MTINPQTLATFLASLASMISAGVADFGDPGLAIPVKAAITSVGGLVIAIWVYSVHATERAKVQGAAHVAASKGQAEATGGAVVHQVLQALGGQPPAG